jgi:uncharacterized damage-inducible protein DinB
MTPRDLIVLNLQEVRRRSIKVWTAIPADNFRWRPDPDAMSCIEMVRHVLEGEYSYMEIIKARRSIKDLHDPFESLPFISVEDELDFAKPYRKEFLELVQSFSPYDLEGIQIDRSDVGYVRKLGDFLLRVGYHESMHCGQLMGYLRTMQVERPKIWD